MRLALLSLLVTSAAAVAPREPVAGNGVAQRHGRVIIEIRTFTFRPAVLEVSAGTHVSWLNHDEIAHTATAVSTSSTDTVFHVSLAGKGVRDGIRFERAGTYAYHCERHPFMRGEIRVHPRGEGQ